MGRTKGSKYRGVWPFEVNGQIKFYSKIKFFGKYEIIGNFNDEKSAALAYDVRARQYFGDLAILNGVVFESDFVERNKK